ncbi:hypothetical protein AOQ84DRAFT_443187 [Glonium stellatum]|uniref:Uncharacterized protein n=1 Tax=Glonium stellatum TaxID=574774 RepID=A0A8E2JN14_9PEZI|nr:hypothetical protein AOQ84DRAFT_443187 [Glonium stellatum]
MSSLQLPPEDIRTSKETYCDSHNIDPPPELIIIGIDFGMTYTGVAFSTLNCPEPHVIKSWPCPPPTRVANKVPTAIAYRAGRKWIRWGFNSPAPADTRRGMAVWDRFKLYLDPPFLEKLYAACDEENKDLVPTYDDVKMWFEDFLKELYDYIVIYITEFFKLEDWEQARVVYSFSVPTTWDHRIEVVKTFEDIIKKAGFGKSERHSVKIELTEAEAAAVYTATSWQDHIAVDTASRSSKEVAGVREGNILMVCDAGGGTTDVSVLKVGAVNPFKDRDGKEEEIAALEQLDCVEGKAIGSVQIDEAFQTEAERRLRIALHENGDEPEDATSDRIKRAVDEMTKSLKGMSFQHFKTTFGTPQFLDYIKVRLPDFKNVSCPEVGVEGGRMTFTYNEIEEMFDDQIRGIFDLIQEQLERLEKIDQSHKVSHFVISGGLGSSKYVQDRIKKRFGPAPGGKGMAILVAKDPQLSVCKGLVIDHVHQTRFENSILSTTYSRASYGIVFNEPYSETQHSSRRSHKVSIDGKEYALNQIRWLVRAGEPIKRDKPIQKTFYRIVDPKAQDTILCKDTIVCSRARASHLPNNVNEENVELALHIKSKLDLHTLRRKDYVERRGKVKFLGLRAKVYWEIEHTILVHAGPTNLRFEIRVGEKVIGETPPVPIMWTQMREARQDSVVNGEDMEDADYQLFELTAGDPPFALISPMTM